MQQVASWMTAEVESVDASASVAEVRERLEQGRFHHLPVVEGERLVGMIAPSDLLRAGPDADDPRVRARNLMHERPVTVRRSAPVIEAARMLCDGNLHSLPVVDDAGRLEGILTSTDLIRLLISKLE